MGYFTSAKWEILAVDKSDKFLAKVCTFATSIQFERCHHLTHFFFKLNLVKVLYLMITCVSGIFMITCLSHDHRRHEP